MRLKWRLGLGWVCAALLPVAAAAPPPVEAFFKDPDIVQAVLSPAGTRLAITTTVGAGRAGLAILDLAPGAKLNRIVQFRDGDVEDVHWVNDERLVFGVVDFSEGSGEPNGAPGLFAIKPEGGDIYRLVRREKRPFVSNPTADRALEWNHRLLRVPQPVPGQPNEEVLVAELALDGSYAQFPKWLNTRTGRSRLADFNTPPSPVGWITDSRGEARVVFTQGKNLQTALWRGPGQTEWTTLYESRLLDVPFAVEAVDDAGGLYVTRADGPEGLSVLTRYDFARNAPEPEPWIVTPGFDFEGSVITEWGSGKAKGVRLTVDAETTIWLDPAMKAFQKLVDEKFPIGVNHVSCRRCGQPDMVALIRNYSDHNPGYYWVYQAQPQAGSQA